jgi:hypothetical protein
LERDSTASPGSNSTGTRDNSSIIATRSDLIQALCDAAQLEHALCCAYLFAALSLKRSANEGVPQARLADLRNWESAFLLISRQEMIHLGIVGNLLTAIGGMPYLEKPAFPIKAHRYGELPELPLERFSKKTIERLILFETPEWDHVQLVILRKLQTARGLSDGLSVVCDQICAETQWSAADVWRLEANELLPVLRVRSGLNVSYDEHAGQQILARWQTPHPPQGQQFQPPQSLGPALVNTFVEIPVYKGRELIFILILLYDIYCGVFF